MSESVTPYVQRTTFADAIRSVVPLIAQQQAQAQRQQQFEQSLALRLAQEQRLRAKDLYDAQQDQKKADRAAQAELARLSGDCNYDDAEEAVKAFAQQQFEENPELLTSFKDQLGTFYSRAQATHDFLDEKQGEFADYTYGTKSIDGQQWTGKEEDLNAIVNRLNFGAFDPASLALDENNRIIASYYGPKMVNGKPEIVGTGPIEDAPFYDREIQMGQFSLSAYTAPLASRDPLTFYENNIDSILENVASQRIEGRFTDVEAEREYIQTSLISALSPQTGLSPELQEAKNTAIEMYAQDTATEVSVIRGSKDETNKAIAAYAGKVSELHVGGSSDAQRYAGISNLYNKDFSTIYRQIERLDLSELEKDSEFRKRVHNMVFDEAIGNSNAMRGARNFAKNDYLTENSGNVSADTLDDDDRNNYLQDLEDALIGIAPPFSDSAQPKATATEIKKQEEANAVLQSSTQISVLPISDFDAEILRDRGVEAEEDFDVSTFETPTLNVGFDLSPYLTDRYRRLPGKPIKRKFDEEGRPIPKSQQRLEEIPGDFKEVVEAPKKISAFIDEQGQKIIILHGFTDQNIPLVPINIDQDLQSKNRIDQLLSGPFGGNITVDELFSIHNKNLFN